MIRPLVAALAALSVVPAAAQDFGVPEIEVLAGPCAACHGPDGKSAGLVPSLYGRPSEALAQLLLAFKNDAAPATVMNRLAKGYSDEQLRDLARYFGDRRAP